MPGSKYHVPYSKTILEFALPATMDVSMAVSQPVSPVKDFRAAIVDALAQPIGTPPLRALAKPGTKVCIVFTDITRASPDHELVPALLLELEKAGVRDADITLLCGIGMHRPSTYEEKVTKLGLAVVNRYRVIDNEPQNPQALVDLGVTGGGVPVQVHRASKRGGLAYCHGYCRAASIRRLLRRT